MNILHKKAIVVHSGGMDSSLCLAIAIKEFGSEEVCSLTFSYGQRHIAEINQAKKICLDWKVEHFVVDIASLQSLTTNALMDKSQPVLFEKDKSPNTLVVGRNGLMTWLAAIYSYQIQAQYIYLGVMELEAANSGYRDCSRDYMDRLEAILRIDLDNPLFEIRTPLVNMLKKDTLLLAYNMGILEYLLKNTMTCYEGISHLGCQKCPACLLRNEGVREFLKIHPDFIMPY